jgi:hypothetical protein
MYERRICHIIAADAMIDMEPATCLTMATVFVFLRVSASRSDWRNAWKSMG